MLGGLTKVISNNNPEVNESIKALSWIKEGSLLDRRGSEEDRRDLSDRRKNSDQAFKGKEKRHKDTRRVSKRRHQSIESIQANNASKVEMLKQGYYNLIVLVEKFKLTIASGTNNSLDKHINDLSNIIRSYTHREELVFYAYLDTAKNQTNEILMVLNLHIYNAGEEVLEIINQYRKIEMEEPFFESLILDLDKIKEILTTSFKNKDEFLYSKYQQIPGF